MCSRRKFSQNKLAIFAGAIYNKLSVAGQGVLPLAGNLTELETTLPFSAIAQQFLIGGMICH